LSDKKYYYSSWNALALGTIVEWTGIDAILMFGTNIFIKMRQEGSLTLDPIHMVQI
jgi:hypothetical protein